MCEFIEKLSKVTNLYSILDPVHMTEPGISGKELFKRHI